MLGAGLQCNRRRGDDRLYNPAKSRRNYNQNQKNYQLQRNQSDIEDKQNVSGARNWVREPEDLTEETPKPTALPTLEKFESSLSNVERFLEAIAPSVDAQFLSKTTMRGWRTCDVEFQPYFMLSDLWDSYKEWSAYGAGVPLMLNGNESVIQYYVPYLSGIQIYMDPSKSHVKSRRTSEDNDGDYFGRDSSSGGSSDSEHDRGLMYSRGQRNRYIQPSDVSLKMERLFLRDQDTMMQEGFLSDEGEFGSHRDCLLFEYLEQDPPYGREPIACKISDLASRFPELKTLRSCDLLSSSWLSVAWYPIYRIPIGTTLKDLDACFLTYHSLYTPIGDVAAAQAPVMIYPNEFDGIPRISLPAFGLATYKFRGSLWTSNTGSDQELVSSLSVVAGNWLRVLQANHPDYVFFSRR